MEISCSFAFQWTTKTLAQKKRQTISHWHKGNCICSWNKFPTREEKIYAVLSAAKLVFSSIQMALELPTPRFSTFFSRWRAQSLRKKAIAFAFAPKIYCSHFSPNMIHEHSPFNLNFAFVCATGCCRVLANGIPSSSSFAQIVLQFAQKTLASSTVCLLVFAITLVFGYILTPSI